MSLTQELSKTAQAIKELAASLQRALALAQEQERKAKEFADTIEALFNDRANETE